MNDDKFKDYSIEFDSELYNNDYDEVNNQNISNTENSDFDNIDLTN